MNETPVVRQSEAVEREERAAPVDIGLDDGFALTKVALPDGRLVAVPSRARMGRANVTWLDEAKRRIFEYETEGHVFAVGEVEGEPTEFPGYPYSSLNRAIVQHALQAAGLGGQSLHAVSGLPVTTFYLENGTRREDTVARKRESLKRRVEPLDGRVPASVAFHEVIPEALAAWYDHVITERAGETVLERGRLEAPIAVVDIGGRTTDYVVVADQAVVHGASGSLRSGLLDIRREVREGLRARFGLEEVGERTVREAVRHRRVRLFGETHEVSALVEAAEAQLVERLRAETERKLGRGAELERILFVGGGALALAAQLRGWFPNQAIAEHPLFANARGMLKYLRYVGGGEGKSASDDE